MIWYIPSLKSLFIKQSSNLMTVVVVLMVFLVGFSWFNAAVVCYGADGHIALEGPLTGFCSQTASTSESSMLHARPESHIKPLVAGSIHPSHDCKDVPLHMSQATTPRLSIQSKTLALFEKSIHDTSLNTPLHLNRFLQSAGQGLQPHPPPALCFQLALIRTVRLLI